MKGGIGMTRRQIESSREARLWLTQVAFPIIGVVMLVPETRKAVTEEFKKLKKTIENKFKN